MKQKFSVIVLIIICLVLMQGCAPNPYATTNRAYKKQVKEYAKLLREYPLQDSRVSNEPASWVGTTNFSVCVVLIM